MNDTESLLVERIRERVKDTTRFVDMPDVINKADFHQIPAPVPIDELKVAERRLGFELPSLLRMLYLQIGNGGFGPGYGLIGLNERGAKNYYANLVDAYLESVNFSHPDYPPFPRQFITICNWGDGITSALKRTDLEVPVFRIHGDRYEDGPWEAVMTPEAASLHAWLEDWLSDRPLDEKAKCEP